MKLLSLKASLKSQIFLVRMREIQVQVFDISAEDPTYWAVGHSRVQESSLALFFKGLDFVSMLNRKVFMKFYRESYMGHETFLLVLVLTHRFEKFQVPGLKWLLLLPTSSKYILVHSMSSEL